MISLYVCIEPGVAYELSPQFPFAKPLRSFRCIGRRDILPDLQRTPQNRLVKADTSENAPMFFDGA